MKRSRFLAFLMGLMVFSTVHAVPINENQAKSIAAGFMARRAFSGPGLELAMRAPRLGGAPAGQAAYYVFNSSDGQQGFVIVAGDDRVPAVLGYGDHGNYNPEDAPEALKALLDSYSEQIEALDHGAEAAPTLKGRSSISPLLPTAWSQVNPYNIMLPQLQNGNHVVTGCAATSMAQVMRYWRCPPRPSQTIPEYTSSTLDFYMPALQPVDFDWDNMQNNYLTSEPQSQSAIAVATLMLYCAQSIEMDFKNNASSASGSRIAMAMADYFGYSGGAHSVSRVNYSSQQWADIIYSELAAGRPVIYNAMTKASGHSFVCDGYDGNGMFHINWGWNGASNGYFLLDILDPDLQGTASSNSYEPYVFTQSAIVGIEPGNGGGAVKEVTAANFFLEGSTTIRKANNGQFSVTISDRFYNYTSQSFPVYLGWGLFDGDSIVEEIETGFAGDMEPGYYMYVESEELKFGSSIRLGTYTIKPVYSLDGENWTPCVGSDRNYIEVEFYYNSCTITGHGTSAEMDYLVNYVQLKGTMHPRRPIHVNVNMTNMGESTNNILNMYVDFIYRGSAFVGLEKDERDDVQFTFVVTEPGSHRVSFSWENGDRDIAYQYFTVTPMPSATLSGTIKTLNVADAVGSIINSDKFSVQLTVLNTGSTPYDEDITVNLYKNMYGSSGTLVQAMSQRVMIEPGQTQVVTFDLDNVMDGWRYFVTSGYYSNAEYVSLAGTSFYTVVFPPKPVKGDVNNDREVNIADVNMAIDIILTGSDNMVGDVNGDGEVNIADINEIINIILNDN